MTKKTLFSISLFFACVLLSHFSYADGVITNGTTMRVHGETYYMEYGDGIIHNGASLKIFGNVTFSGSLINLGDENGIIVESDASYTGSLIYTWGHPMITVKRYLTDGRWHMISPPTEGVISHQYYFNDNPRVWLTKYHETDDSYEYIYSLNLPMPRGQGYGYWVDESKSDVIIAIHGELEAESFFLSELSEPPLHWSDAEHGYNLVGNPYSSAIDFNNGDWNLFNMEESIWVWFPDLEETGYCMINLV